MLKIILFITISSSLIQISQQANCTKLFCPEYGYYFDYAKTCNCQECCPSCSKCSNSQSCEVCSPNTTIYSGLMNTLGQIVCSKDSGNAYFGIQTPKDTQNLGAGWSDEKCKNNWAILNPGARCLSEVEMCYVDKRCDSYFGLVLSLLMIIMG